MSDTSSDQPTSTPDDESTQQPVPVVGTVADDKVVIVTPDGMGIANRESEAEAGDAGSHHAAKRPTNPADLVEEPAKVMRIGAMIKQLLEEVRGAPLDEKGRARLAEIHHRSIDELKDGLAPELVAELDRIALPFSEDAPSDAELRIAQAQLVGDGLDLVQVLAGLVANVVHGRQRRAGKLELPAGLKADRPAAGDIEKADRMIAFHDRLPAKEPLHALEQRADAARPLIGNR
mgnify:CR=1 FL=1